MRRGRDRRPLPRLGRQMPWMTGAVVYRDVWWEHDAAGLRDPYLARVEQLLGKGRDD